MLLQVRDYIQSQGQVSAQQLCRHFSIEYSALEPMLQRWQLTGMIVALKTKNACAKKCIQCSPEPLVYYQYQR